LHTLISEFPLNLTDQEERSKAIESFKSGKKDVLVATDVASKGLDFPQIQHVINYDMPDDIENYGNYAYFHKTPFTTTFLTIFFCSSTNLFVHSQFIGLDEQEDLVELGLLPHSSTKGMRSPCYWI